MVCKIFRLSIALIMVILTPHAFGENIKWAKNKKLCEKVLNEDVSYADLNNPSNNYMYGDENLLRCHKLTGDECFGTKVNSINIDIDNDGVKENVVWMESSTCNFSFLAVANDALNELADSGTDKLLQQATYKEDMCQLPSGLKGFSYPFLYKEKWYIEVQYKLNSEPNRQPYYHNVILLQNNKAEKICEFSSKYNVTESYLKTMRRSK